MNNVTQQGTNPFLTLIIKDHPVVQCQRTKRKLLLPLNLSQVSPLDNQRYVLCWVIRNIQLKYHIVDLLLQDDPWAAVASWFSSTWNSESVFSCSTSGDKLPRSLLLSRRLKHTQKNWVNILMEAEDNLNENKILWHYQLTGLSERDYCQDLVEVVQRCYCIQNLTPPIPSTPQFHWEFCQLKNCCAKYCSKTFSHRTKGKIFEIKTKSLQIVVT